ncbi:MAG: hypothetical protein KAR38_10950 [Calditrichia bacterium]|nr:hypothetical protein [Calditrichia bacterium]
MKKIIILILALSFNQIYSQGNEKHSFVKNWSAAQFGELGGWFLTMASFKLLNNSSNLLKDDNESNYKFTIYSGITVGNLTGNYLLKKISKRDNSFYLKNILFSSIPTVLYVVLKKPEFNLKDKNKFYNYNTPLGLIITSIFLTPVFSAIGNEIFEKKITEKNNYSNINLSPIIFKREKLTLGVNLYMKF